MKLCVCVFYGCDEAFKYMVISTSDILNLVFLSIVSVQIKAAQTFKDQGISLTRLPETMKTPNTASNHVKEIYTQHSSISLLSVTQAQSDVGCSPFGGFVRVSLRL